MYLNFYKLKKEPFKNAPDPEFLFQSPSHKEALASIIYGVEQRKGFITITGEVGVGKTSVLRYYLEQVVKPDLKTIYIFNPARTFSGLMKEILQKQGFSPKTDDPAELVTQFHQILIDRFKQGHNVVLIIDEAQNMPVETLENLRMLSNLETSKEKLLQIVLVGQPELEEKLHLKELRQLRQRIAIKTTISPLSKQECFQYIEHRLAKASLFKPEEFTRGALKKIIAESRGIPRIINVLCDNALITGFGYQKKKITPDIAQEVIDDFRGKKITTYEMGLLIVTAVLVLVTGVFLVVLFRGHEFSPMAAIQQPDAQDQDVNWDVGKEDGQRNVRPAEDPGQSSTLSSTPAPKPGNGPAPIIKTVKQGDTLYSLSCQVYGYADRDVLKSVMKHNPSLASGNRILAGQKIAFPPPDSSRADK